MGDIEFLLRRDVYGLEYFQVQTAPFHGPFVAMNKIVIGNWKVTSLAQGLTGMRANISWAPVTRTSPNDVSRKLDN